MSTFHAIRSFGLMCVIACGLITAAWSGAKDLAWVHDRDRGDVVWLAVARG
jgi:hypothetical protein